MEAVITQTRFGPATPRHARRVSEDSTPFWVCILSWWLTRERHFPQLRSQQTPPGNHVPMSFIILFYFLFIAVCVCVCVHAMRMYSGHVHAAALLQQVKRTALESQISPAPGRELRASHLPFHPLSHLTAPPSKSHGQERELGKEENLRESEVKWVCVTMIKIHAWLWKCHEWMNLLCIINIY